MKRYAAGCLLSIGLMSSCALLGQDSADKTSPVDFGVSAGFTMLHANIAPGQCSCFFMYGGSAQFTAGFTQSLAFVADFGATKASNVSGVDRDFTLSTYQAGIRYTRTYRLKYRPYAQVMAGLAHLDTNFAIDSGLTRGAYSGGGGLDYRLTNRFDLRTLEVMYVGTSFDNGSNDRQNQFRLTTGLVFHISKPKDEVQPFRITFLDRERHLGLSLAARLTRHNGENAGEQ